MLIASTGAERLSGLVVAALVARALGPTAFGEYSLVLVIWNIFGVVAYFGQGQILSREVIRQPERAGVLLGTSAGMALGASAIAGVLAILSSVILGHSDIVVAGVGIAAAAILWADSQCNVVESLLIALQRVAPIAAINIVASAARMIVSIALLGRGLSVTALLWVIGVTQILTALALWRVARTTVRDQRLAWDGVIARNSARSALFFTGGGLASILFKRFDTLLVEGMLGAAALGIYSAAFRLYLIIQSASPPILRLLLPRFAQAHTQSSREVANQVRSTSATLSVVFGTLVIGLVSLSPIVLTAIFGSAYAQSVPAYLLLSMSTMPLVLNGVFTTAANAIHLEARTVQAGVVNGIAGVAMSYVCISLFGVAGAAAGVIFASALGLIQAAWILRSANALDARGALFVAAAGLTFPSLACVGAWAAYASGASMAVYIGIGGACEIALLMALRSSARTLAVNVLARLKR